MKLRGVTMGNGFKIGHSIEHELLELPSIEYSAFNPLRC